MSKLSPAQRWQLYIDESGDFGSSDWPQLIAGIALAGPDGSLRQSALRAAIERCVPDVQWPPHFSRINRPADRLATMLARHLHGDAPLTADGASICVSAFELMAELPDNCFPWRQAVEGNTKVDYAQVTAMDAWLEANQPGLYGALVQRRSEDDRKIRALLAEIDQTVPVLVVVATYDERPAGADAYLDLLPVLYERLFCLLRGGERRHEVWAHHDRRDVQPPDGPGRPIRLRNRDVGRTIQEAASFPFHKADGFGDERVRIRPAGVHRYGPAAPPGLVLADFVANRLRRAMLDTNRNRPYRRLADAAEQRLRLEVERKPEGLNADRLPTVAVAGRCRDAVRNAFAGHVPVPFVTQYGWMGDQARAWVEAVP